jgi:hypothetical protein
MLIEKHVKGQPGEFFARIDEVRNRLLHGDDPVDIEQALAFKWHELTDALGKATWAALLSNLVNMTAANAAAPGKLAIADTNTYAHYEMNVITDMSMRVKHADPANPQIDEFQLPNFKLDLIVKDHDEVEPPPGAERRIAGDD